MSTPDSAPHDYIDAEFMIEGLATATDEKTLLGAFAGREGIHSLTIFGKILIVEYEPVYIHKTQIVAAITGAGFRVAGVESALASPIDDAIFEDGLGHPNNPSHPPAPSEESKS